MLWQTHRINPAQEHFISNLIRQKLIVAIDSLPLPPHSSTKVMLFLPENELHELSLLFSHYLIRKAGHRTFYLGQAIPFTDLKSAYEVHQPDTLITCITSSVTKDALEKYITNLAAAFKASEILLTGFQVHNYTPRHSNVHILKHIADLSAHL